MILLSDFQQLLQREILKKEQPSAINADVHRIEIAFVLQSQTNGI